MKKILWAAIALTGLVACNSTNDNGVPLPPGYPRQLTEEQKDSLYADSIMKLSQSTVLHAHTRGNGFNVVIMGDGYTKADIESQKFRNASLAAMDALFEQEPMKSLQDYVDVIEVQVPSDHSGVDYTKRRTGLRTSLSRGQDSNVYGDSITILNCAVNAISKRYNATSTQELTDRFDQTLIITLLNTEVYKGVTLLGINTDAPTEIPKGYSLSYVPAYAKVGNVNVFPYLIRHEGVGHGIGKLADEYSYDNYGTPTGEAINSITKYQQYGLYQNITYKANATTHNATFDIESSSWLYPFTQRSEYMSEYLKWYVGGANYPVGFCRLGYHSTMNETFKDNNGSYDPNSGKFNVAARAMIYKRIMRAASSTWQWNFSAFTSFDAAARQSYATSNARGTVNTAVKSANVPALAAPKVVKIPASKIIK